MFYSRNTAQHLCDLNSVTVGEIASLEGVTLEQAYSLTLWRPYLDWMEVETVPGLDYDVGSACCRGCYRGSALRDLGATVTNGNRSKGAHSGWIRRRFITPAPLPKPASPPTPSKPVHKAALRSEPLRG